MDHAARSGPMYESMYKKTPIQPDSDYSIEADIRFSSTGSYSGGIVGRLNPITGQRYAVWVCPGSSLLRFIRFSDWTHWSEQGVASAVKIPVVGSGWHHIKMTFSGSHIQVFYDFASTPNLNIQDTNFKTGYAGLDFWTETDALGPGYTNFSISDPQSHAVFKDNFGVDLENTESQPGLAQPHFYRGLVDVR
jgi:hypothetical protein